MALLFRREASVLHFGPRLPKDPNTNQRLRWRARRYVLWPTLMYRVVAPEVRDRQLNVLQKAVLGMCRAGVSHVDRIGERLHIHADLAAVVARELLQRGLLGSNGLPTEKGLDLFQEESLEAHRMVTGHVFQDPWSGDLWPRFVEKLDFVELQPNPNGFPDLMLGSKGKPRRERAFMVLLGDRAAPPAPSASEIVRVTKRHRSALRRSHSYELADEDDTFAHAGSTAVDRVSLVDERPTPVFVTSFMYLPEAGDLAGEWYACDPFGLGISPALRRDLERELRSSSGLRAVLENMIGQSLDHQIEEQRQMVGLVRAMAVNNIEKALSVNARELPQYDALVDLEYAHVEVEQLGDACPEHKLRDLFGAARRALERTLAAIFRRHPPGEVWRRVYADRRPVEDSAYCQRVYEASANAIGLRVPLPNELARVKPSQVRASCHPDGGGWRLRPTIVAAVLAARDNTAHPLRRAAAKEPMLLDVLNNVASEAGAAVHNGAAPSLQSVPRVVADVYRAVGLLSGLDQPLDSTRH